MNLIGRLKHNVLLYTTAKKLLGMFRKSYMMFCNKLFGIDDKSVVFLSFGGESYSDNPRAISEKLHEIAPNFKIIWLFIDPFAKKKVVPGYVTCIRVNSLKSLRVLATSKFWVDNFNKPLHTYKSKKQIYIQTWHGDRGFKKILHDSTFVSENYKLFDSEHCDLSIAGSKYGEMQYRSAFKYEGSIMKKGCPRNDILIRNDVKAVATIKKDLNIEINKKVLLYAPTLRRISAKNKTHQKVKDINLTKIIDILNKTTEHEWVCLIRAHSAVRKLSGIPEDINIVDVSNHEDMSELLLITDMLITDYSSSPGDFALLDRPIILFQNDRAEYLENDRTFYFDIDKSPFIIAMKQQELEEIILNMDSIDFKKNCKEILDFYETSETGMASEAVANYIVSKGDE